jgi:hypothetical protein
MAALFPFDLPSGEETGAGVDHLGQSRSQSSLQPVNHTHTRLSGRFDDGKTTFSHRSERPHHEPDQLSAVGQSDRCGRHTNFTIPVAEHDRAGLGVPGGPEVQVVAPHVGEEHTVGRRLGHSLSMHPERPGCQRPLPDRSRAGLGWIGRVVVSERGQVHLEHYDRPEMWASTSVARAVPSAQLSARICRLPSFPRLRTT